MGMVVKKKEKQSTIRAKKISKNQQPFENLQKEQGLIILIIQYFLSF